MAKLSLEAIQLVDIVERTGSFSAAAERLHKAPSTISYLVAMLEQQLGLKLFERHGPKVRLSKIGEELLREGRWLLQAADDLENRLQRLNVGYETELRIVIDELIPVEAFAEDIRAFDALKSSTRLRFLSEVMTGAWEALKENRADLIIAAGEGPPGGGYKAKLVGTVEFVFCVSPSHPLAKLPQPISREDLLRYPAIAVADSARSMPARTVGLLAGQNRLTVPTMSAKIALQIAGLGHGFLPQPMIEQALRRCELIQLETEEPAPVPSFWLAWKHHQQGEALKWWCKRLDRQLLPALLH
jgi:DNA-binding transcriptional LysR family regulator